MALVMKQPDLGTSLTYVPDSGCGRFDGGFALETDPDYQFRAGCHFADRLSICLSLTSGTGW